MRKGAGISGLSRHTATSTSYSALSSTLSTQQLTSLQTSLESFRASLLAFAAKHRADIRADPAFRHQFQKMCAAIGVDPLAAGSIGGGKGGVSGWWTEMLGLGEWQIELAVQIVDVCVSTRERNGGIIEMGELIMRIERMRRSGSANGNETTLTTTSTFTSSGSTPKGKQGVSSSLLPSISPEDIRRSIELLKPLCSYTIVTPSFSTSTHSSSTSTSPSIGMTSYVRSVPRELDTDQTFLITLASESGGRLTESTVSKFTGWTLLRTRTALDDCVMNEGIGWVDEQDEQEGKSVWLLAAVDFRDS